MGLVAAIVGSADALFGDGFQVFFVHIDLPDAYGVVCAAGREESNVG